MNEEQKVANIIWQQINDEDYFSETNETNMYQRVSYILKTYHSDMVEEAPFFTSVVKSELLKIFKQNGL